MQSFEQRICTSCLIITQHVYYVFPSTDITVFPLAVQVKRPSSGGDGGVEGVACEDEQPGRKNKSLSLLCQR